MSLKRIVLRDFVIVSELELELAQGFTVLTGETGAGKSILIDALQLVTGGRADASVIREGAQRADVSAEFDNTPMLSTWLEQAGFDAEPSLLLRRTVEVQGKSRAWINGSPATATQLRRIGEQLLDIHGQHAWQSLTNPTAIRGLLDAYAQTSSVTLATLWQSWRKAQNDLVQAHAAQEAIQNQRERLAWQLGELAKLAPQPNEWEHLNTEHDRLANAHALLDAAQSAEQLLDNPDNSALSALHNAHQLLQQQEHLEQGFKGIAEVLASSLAQAQDAIHSLRAYLRKTEPDPQRLSELDERMALWLSLARRYKHAPSDLPALCAAWQQQLEQIDATDLLALQTAETVAHDAYMEQANSLSKIRTEAAPQLAQVITQAMQGLGMQGGQFEVILQKLSQPTSGGLEDVSFLVAGHAGSTPRPVNKVASGGELSRMALAIAVTTSQLGSAQTLIFDEVDAGIGGAVAETVGRLLKQLGVDRQVLAVTHLPQVAACADHHLLVAKQVQGPRTVSSVVVVQGAQRVSEVARMLGGERLSSATLAHARDLLQVQE